ncbi:MULTISPECIES: YihY/virulence factor BrkB family protein [Niastella]|uniref:YihY/virulence factor BrkB family protein n=1 Tax=Niastella soli TaxID=2821487 RepID=A0ABS3YY75_9BACT|nr:YihY/virulence factor BrkB family protein [Niastella soli]MBO9202880.1 YihY/virulence factor BrkB family protein [Niastella soli]
MAKQKSIWNLSVAGKLLKESFHRLQSNDPLRMAGATAFFTSFALPPIMVLLFQFFSIFFSKKLVGTELRSVLTTTLGNANTEQLRIIARGLRNLAQNWYMAVIGLLFLIFVATTLFKVIRNTLNDIWHIRPEQTGFFYDLKVRGKSLVIILAAAILFIAGEIITIAREVAGKYVASVGVTGSPFLSTLLNHLFGVLTIIVWFIVLFRFLANGRPSWRVATTGGILTGVLFYFGKAVLSAMMRHSNAGIVYGAGAAIVLILLFMFYSSFILYFGASFIKEYSDFTNDPIVPRHKAYQYELHKVGGRH